MIETPPRRKRGRPSNAEIAARKAAEQAALPVADLNIGGQREAAAQCAGAADADAALRMATTLNASAGVGTLIAEIRQLYRRRKLWQRAELRLMAQVYAICRGATPDGDTEEDGRNKSAMALAARVKKGEETVEFEVVIACAPLLSACGVLAKEREAVEKVLTKLGKQLPAFSFVEGVRGVGPLSYAQLIGECGDFSKYKSVAAVWKRLGLAVINGGRQRRVEGADALMHGYDPQRRSLVWNIATSMMKAQKPEDYYRIYYDAEKARQMEKLAAEAPEGKEPSKLLAHRRACRHMSKRFIRDLVVFWWREQGRNFVPAE